MIFTIQNLGFAIGGFLLEGWLAFAARCVCALVLLALGAVARALLRKKIFPKLLAHSWHFEATGILLRSFALPAERMVWLTGIYFALASLPWAIAPVPKFLLVVYQMAMTLCICKGLYHASDVATLLLKSCGEEIRSNKTLLSLLDTTFPDANRLFTSPPRADGSEKWVDFVATFWHCECVCGRSEKAFTTQYQKWCRKHGYNFSEDKALDIYASACRHFGVIPKTDTAKLLVEQAISQLQTTSAALAALKQEMQSLAASLPEYPVVMEMFGVGPTLGPQLIAEIGDVRRFHSKKALVAFAGIDAPPYQSGQIDVRSRSISKRGSASLRRTLFLVMGVLLQCAPMDEPVYQFMNKKRSEGKPYRVYMMASANKFLRIYYASVKAYLDSLEHD